MKKAILKFLFLTALIFLFGCATTIKVKLLKPAEINLGTRKKIAVLNFDLSMDINKFDYNLYYNETYNKSKIPDSIIQSLIENRHFAVIEREQLSKIISEQGLSATGLVDKNSAIKMGKLFGVDALLIGSGEYYINDTIARNDQSKTFPDRTVYYQEAKINRNVTVKITYRIIDTSTGEIIVARNLSDSQNTSTTDFPEKGTEKIQYNNNPVNINDPFQQPAVNPIGNDDIYYYEINDRFTSLTEWQNMADSVIERLTRKIVYQIAPHYVEEEKEIKDGDSKPMKEGLEYAKKGLWENARDAWETLVNDSSSDAIKDHTAAMYNLGIYYEINGNLAKSEYYFAEAYKNSGDEEYLKDKARVEQREKEVEILKEEGRQEDLETNKSRDNVKK